MLIKRKAVDEMPNDAGAAESARLLDALYQLKEVDLTTVRRIGGAPPPPVVKRSTIARERLEEVVLPWMRSHGGIGSQHELEDCLDEDFRESPDFGEYFVQVTPDLYCEDCELASLYRRVIECALTYFYRPHLCYPLRELTSLLERESAREWLGFPDQFVERCLTLSPHFRARKEESGRMVRRSHLSFP